MLEIEFSNDNVFPNSVWEQAINSVTKRELTGPKIFMYFYILCHNSYLRSNLLTAQYDNFS